MVPLDVSLTAEAILAQVRRVLYRNDSEVILVRAVVPPPVENSMVLAEASVGAAREYVAGKQERLKEAGVRVKSVVRIGSPLGVILDVAEEEKATLIAMATHGATGLARLLMGSVAEGVMRKSPVPVLLVRPFWSYEVMPAGGVEHRPIRNILVPVDGSETSLAGVDAVVEMADLFEARVILLRVIEGKKRKAGTADPLDEAEEETRQLAKSVERRGVETLTLIEKGDPAEQILKAARFHEADLVAMATHGRSGLSRLVTGSVTEKVLRNANVPLLVTRTVAAGKKKKVLRTAKSGK